MSKVFTKSLTVVLKPSIWLAFNNIAYIHEWVVYYVHNYIYNLYTYIFNYIHNYWNIHLLFMSLCKQMLIQNLKKLWIVCFFHILNIHYMCRGTEIQVTYIMLFVYYCCILFNRLDCMRVVGNFIVLLFSIKSFL